MKTTLCLALLAVAVVAQINKEYVTIQNVNIEVNIPANSCVMHVRERFALFFEEVGSTFLTRRFSNSFLPEGSVVRFASTPEVIVPQNVAVSTTVTKGIAGPELKLNIYRFPMRELFYMEVTYIIDGWLFSNEKNQTEMFFGANYYMNRIPLDTTGSVSIRFPYKTLFVNTVHKSGLLQTDPPTVRYEYGNTVVEKFGILDGYDYAIVATLPKNAKECSRFIDNMQDGITRSGDMPSRKSSYEFKFNSMQILFFSLVAAIGLVGAFTIAVSCIVCHIKARKMNNRETVQLDQVVLDQVKITDPVISSS